MLWEHVYLNVSLSFTYSVYSRIWEQKLDVQ